jgi:hypothetical protein
MKMAIQAAGSDVEVLSSARRRGRSRLLVVGSHARTANIRTVARMH